MSKSTISLKAKLDTPDIVAFLEDLVASIKAGKVVVQRDTEFVALTPVAPLDLELEATVKKGKQKICLELSWSDEAKAEIPQIFKVSSVMPEVPAETLPQDANPVQSGFGETQCASIVICDDSEGPDAADKGKRKKHSV